MSLGESRGGSEVLFMVLITGVVVLAGTMAVSLGSDITTSTSEQITQPEFELTKTDPVVIRYTGDDPIRPSVTDELYFQYENGTQTGIRFGVYPEQRPIQPDDKVYDSRNDGQTIEYGSRIDVIWSRNDGGGSIVQEIYIPPSNVTGTAVRSNGSVDVTGGFNLSTDS